MATVADVFKLQRDEYMRKLEKEYLRCIMLELNHA